MFCFSLSFNPTSKMIGIWKVRSYRVPLKSIFFQAKRTKKWILLQCLSTCLCGCSSWHWLSGPGSSKVILLNKTDSYLFDYLQKCSFRRLFKLHLFRLCWHRAWRWVARPEWRDRRTSGTRPGLYHNTHATHHSQVCGCHSAVCRGKRWKTQAWSFQRYFQSLSLTSL